MPLEQNGLQQRGGNLERHLEKQIDQVFSMLHRKISELSQAKDLLPAQVRLLQPVHYCVVAGDENVFVVLAVHDIGATAIRNFQDWSGKDMDIPTAIFLAERDLSFRHAFGFTFKRSVLDLDDDRKEAAVTEIAEGYVNEEIEHLEQLNKIVRLNPIFQGREFLINERLVFVLSPFEEPFNTIYEDHIKPSVESIQKLKCLRADDIYDNRPIIEDIWRCTNEARMLIAELTGRNANVFYETGIAHTIGKEVILITQSIEDVPFDLKHLRCFVYEYTPRGIALLEHNLKNTVLNVLARSG